MARLLLFGAFASVWGCGGAAGLSAPPPYTPAATPEAPSHCPGEALAAKKAREGAIGSDAFPDGDRAARAVFALAQCERTHFDRMDIATAQDLAGIRAARDQTRNIRTLYEEVVSYRSPRWLVGALSRTGDLLAAYATKLRQLREAETDELIHLIMTEARDAHRKALEALDGWPDLAGDPDVRGWARAACVGIGKEAVRFRVCAR